MHAIASLRDDEEVEPPGWTREELDREIQKGLDDVDAGRVHGYDDLDAIFESIKTRGRQRLEERRNAASRP